MFKSFIVVPLIKNPEYSTANRASQAQNSGGGGCNWVTNDPCSSWNIRNYLLVIVCRKTSLPSAPAIPATPLVRVHCFVCIFPLLMFSQTSKFGKAKSCKYFYWFDHASKQFNSNKLWVQTIFVASKNMQADIFPFSSLVPQQMSRTWLKSLLVENMSDRAITSKFTMEGNVDDVLSRTTLLHFPVGTSSWTS